MDADGKLSRRTVIGAAAMAGAAAFAEAEAAAPPRKPNIVFIMADDMGAYDLSSYGRPDYRTPRIDSIARDGLKFTFGYANSSTCAPTRVGLISGRYQNRLRAGAGMGGGYTTGDIGYSPELPSLPRVLKEIGYRTALFGKWDIGELPAYGPNKSGYDEFFGLLGGGIDYWTHDLGLFGQGRRPDLYENETPVQVEGYATDLFTARAVDFIERNRANPFFVSLHYNAPHWPWQTRADRAANRTSDFHHDGGSMAIYAEMVKELDEGVGRVLDALDRLHLKRDTIVVFTSDNGGERFSYMWPLRGAKGDLWEGGVRVPLIVRWPRRIARGAETDQVALSMDWLPTFAAIAGAATDPTHPPDGIDLSPQLFGAPSVQRTVFWRQMHDQSALDYPWKYLLRNGHEYLYNLAEDPSERANVKLREPAQFERLKAATAAWIARVEPVEPISPGEYDPEAMEALEGRARAPRAAGAN